MKTLKSSWRLIAASLTMAAGAAAQQPPPREFVIENYTRARGVLDAAIKAHTAGKPGVGFNSFSVKIAGTEHHRHQSLRPEVAPDTTPYTGRWAVDLSRGWVLWEREASGVGGNHAKNRWIVKGNDATNVDLFRKQHRPQPNARPAFEGLMRRFPQTLLREAAGRAATLRWHGETEASGKKYSVISYATPQGTMINLFVESGTNLVARAESMAADALMGDVAAETIFKGYTTVNGMPVPTGQISRLGGVTTLDYDYMEWTLDTPLADSLFELPGGLTPAPQPPAGGAPSVQELGGGLYSIEGLGGYRVLFQEFRDFLMVFEAPQNETTSNRVKSIIREKIPNKPIRYVAITHHHEDHAGGLRGYWAECIPVVTTPGNTPLLRRSLAAQFTIQPDQFASQRPNCSTLADYILEKKGVFTDGSARVELIDIGPSPHANEILVMWFPAQRVLFHADLWNERDLDGTVRPANDATSHFAEWVQKSGLPIERIIGVHGPTGTPAELQRALQMRRSAGN